MILDWLEHGYSLIPMTPGGKEPIRKGWPSLRLTRAQVTRLIERNVNWSARTDGLAVIDCDAPEALDWARAHLPATPLIQRTPRGGMHLFYSDPESAVPPRINFRGLHLDVRSRVSLIMLAYSWSRERERHWELEGGIVRPSELPRLSAELFVTREAQPTRSVSANRSALLSYIAKIRAVAGEGGHNATFRCACRIADSVADPDEALAIILQWNAMNCEPPWSEKELRHKITDAYRRRWPHGHKPREGRL